MDQGEVLPPGQHPFDPSKEDIDAIGFALERIQTFFLWIGEHQATFEAYRNADPSKADNELRYLRDSAEQGLAHLQRLKELLVAGYAIDPNKRLPKGLNEPNTMRVISAKITRLRQP
jgi:hypothetical protein